MNEIPLKVTSAETRAELLRLSGRGYTKVRHLLVQASRGPESSPGKLGAMVGDRKRRSLQLYLLLLTAWPWLGSQAQPLPAAVWARALTTDRGRKWTPTNVSEAWADLERRSLINRTRLSRGVVITPRREDGEAEYTDPSGKVRSRLESYFSLPPSFWTDGWFEELSMPALAMLLAVASKTSRADNPETWLTNEDAGQWFGLSTRSVESGLSELEGHGLLTDRTEWIKAPLSKIGATQRHNYSLTGHFSTTSRLAMQSQAQAERRRRLKTEKKIKDRAEKKSPRRPTAARRALEDSAPPKTRTPRDAPADRPRFVPQPGRRPICGRKE